jgi:hypothetical protein
MKYDEDGGIRTGGNRGNREATKAEGGKEGFHPTLTPTTFRYLRFSLF